MQSFVLGAKRVRQVVQASTDLGVTHLTVIVPEIYPERRDDAQAILGVLGTYLRRRASTFRRAGVGVRFIGDQSILDDRLVRQVRWIESVTDDYDGLQLTIGLNYSGRGEIVQAARQLAREKGILTITVESIDEIMFGAALETEFLPDVDLVIHTGGTVRTLDTLLWKSTYAEVDFTDILWPDFSPEMFCRMTREFSHRTRRFGRLVDSKQSATIT